jgi:AcrR family transcriptional regulator
MSVAALTRHTEATRTAILQAATALLLERKGDGFSVQEVADRAGVTHRTVYRYFATRQELLGETSRRLAPGIAEEPFGQAATVDEWIDGLADHFAVVEANIGVVRSVAVAALASDDLRPADPSLRDRDAHRWEVFRRQFPHLSDGDARRTFATLRHLTSSMSYMVFRLRSGLSPAEVTEAIRMAALQLVSLTAERDSAAKDMRRS